MRRTLPFGGSLLVITLAACLAVGALSWAGYDFRLLSDAFIGDRGDTLLNSRAIQQALDNLRYRPLDPGYSRFFYGEPAAFAYTIAPYGIALPILPLYLLTSSNLVLTYNLYLVGTFILSAWAAYLLIRHVLPVSVLPAVIAALLIAFCQRRFAHLKHIETLSLHYLLLVLVCFHATLRSQRWPWPSLLGVMLALTALTSGYLTMMAAVYMLITVVWLWRWGWLDLAWRAPLMRRLALAALVAAACAAPFAVYRQGNERFRGGYPMAEIVQYTPSIQSWITGNSQVYTRQATTEEANFIGFIALGLALLGWRWRGTSATDPVDPADPTRPAPAPPGSIMLTTHQTLTLFATVTVAGYILSLGPVLKWNGAEVMPLPTMLLYQLPGYALMRAPGRFIFLAVIGTAALAAFAIHQLRSSLTARATAYVVLVLLISGGLVLELLPWNGTHENRISLAGASGSTALVAYPFTTNADVYAWLATQPPDAPILHFPMGNMGEYQYMADLGRHPQPMLNGWGSWLPAWYWNSQWATLPNLRAANFLWQRGVRYLLVHREWLSERALADVEARIASFEVIVQGGLPAVRRFANVTVYELPPRLTPLDFAFDQPAPGEGWDAPTLGAGTILTWMRDPTATFDLALGARRDYALRLVTAVGSAPGVIGQLGVYVGETPLEVTRRQEGGRTFLEAVIPAALVSEGRAFTTLTLRTTGKVAFTRLQVTEITLN